MCLSKSGTTLRSVVVMMFDQLASDDMHMPPSRGRANSRNLSNGFVQRIVEFKIAWSCGYRPEIFGSSGM